MILKDADVRKMSNLADWMLTQHVKSLKGVKLSEIIDKATRLQQEATIDKDTKQKQKYEDLIESLFILRKQLQAKQDY